ncbi:ABC transporter permease [Emticicia aquatilis]|nr:ABC transporter permease [Emticicia aquatilis]
MRNLSFILQKEFRQIFRDKTILRMMFIMPILQLIIIPLAADYEIKHLSISVIDQDHSTYSKRLTSKLTSSGYFRLVQYDNSYSKALENVGNGKTDLILTIPAHFERDLIKENKATLALAADAVSNTKAGLGSSFATQIINDFNNEIREEWIRLPRFNDLPQIQITNVNWYNPHIDYHLFMVPGILAILVTMVGSFLASLNIVSEKEIGTIEQINVTPIKKHEFILGKLIPFWVLGMISVTMGMLVAFAIFRIIPQGSYLLIYLFSGVYLLSVLGIGLLLSTFSDSQQQATLFAFFFMMVFVLMSGLYTPIDSMPTWAKVIAYCNPPMYFVKVIRSIFIKGSGFTDMLPEFGAIVVFAIFFNLLAILNYRKRSA